MQRGIFKLVVFDEGGLAGPPDNLRLVCLAKGGKKVAIWGREGRRENIDKVLAAGLPCFVECEFQEPGRVQAEKFRHTHWLRGHMLTSGPIANRLRRPVGNIDSLTPEGGFHEKA